MRHLQASPILLFALLFLLVGCDETEDTLTLGVSASDRIVADFTFQTFTGEDVDSQGNIEITSNNSDNLRSLLSDFGFSRGDVVSAEVREVRMERLTLGNARQIQPKVFGYLGSVELYYGNSLDGQLIAGQTPVSDDAEIILDRLETDVTSIVQGGAQPLTLLLEVSDPSSIASGGDEVRISVRYIIEVRE